MTALPDGVSITEISQPNTEWTFKGIAESNARVSNFMRNIEASPAFKEPRLDIIETKGGETKGGDKPATAGKVGAERRVNNFTTVVQQKGDETSEADATDELTELVKAPGDPDLDRQPSPIFRASSRNTTSTSQINRVREGW